MAKRSEHAEAERLRDDVPSTVARSDDKAVRTFGKTLESAEEAYDGDERRAHQAAFASLKHSYEKVGDHWEPKAAKGPSDDRAAGSVGTDAPTKGGVDANASKEHLLDVARRLDVRGRSRMTKAELVDAIGRANDRETRRSRETDR